MTESYVFDTYALLEVLEGNSAYRKYSEHSGVIINHFIFAEFCYAIIRKYPPDYTDYAAKLKSKISIIPTAKIMEAMKFRYKHKKLKLSMTDCISYMQAQNQGIRFLTGDRQFANMSGVEFVK